MKPRPERTKNRDKSREGGRNENGSVGVVGRPAVQRAHMRSRRTIYIPAPEFDLHLKPRADSRPESAGHPPSTPLPLTFRKEILPHRSDLLQRDRKTVNIGVREKCVVYHYQVKLLQSSRESSSNGKALRS
jgi:hypothetical protein